MNTRFFALSIAAVMALAAPALARQDTKPKTDDPKPAATKPADPPKTDPKTEPKKTPEVKPAQQEDKIVQVKMTTSMGDIVIDLNETKAPISVANFLSYMDKKHYDGTIFHRVINGFMIQGGGFTPDMKQKKTDAPIKNEWQNGLKNEQYTIAMARLGPPAPNSADSATCQFFINVNNNANLNSPQGDGAAYAVFGKVSSGKEVVDKIKAVETNSIHGKRPAAGQMPDVPVTPVMITKIERVEPAKDAKAPEKKDEKK